MATDATEFARSWRDSWPTIWLGIPSDLEEYIDFAKPALLHISSVQDQRAAVLANAEMWSWLQDDRTGEPKFLEGLKAKQLIEESGIVEEKGPKGLIWQQDALILNI
jgi:hypothetical protein